MPHTKFDDDGLVVSDKKLLTNRQQKTQIGGMTYLNYVI